MISVLEIQNFQAHESLRIDLDPYLTVIVGASDVGKSSVVRALRWLATNKPDGQAFIRSGSETAQVKIKVDGHTIKRIRGKNENRYRLDGEDLKAFGATVPAPVADIFKLGEINFQGQHDAPFWFSESAGFVSRQLNSIINLSSIDNTLGKLNAQLRENGVAVSVCRDRLRQAKEDRTSAAVAEEMDADLRKLEAKEAEIVKVRVAATELRNLIEGVGKYQTIVQNAGKAAMAGKSVGVLTSAWGVLADRVEKLRELVTKGEELGATVREALGRRDGGESRLKQLIGKVCPLCQQPIKK